MRRGFAIANPGDFCCPRYSNTLPVCPSPCARAGPRRLVPGRPRRCRMRSTLPRTTRRCFRLIAFKGLHRACNKGHSRQPGPTGTADAGHASAAREGATGHCRQMAVATVVCSPLSPDKLVREFRFAGLKATGGAPDCNSSSALSAPRDGGQMHGRGSSGWPTGYWRRMRAVPFRVAGASDAVGTDAFWGVVGWQAAGGDRESYPCRTRGRFVWPFKAHRRLHRATTSHIARNLMRQTGSAPQIQCNKVGAPVPHLRCAWRFCGALFLENGNEIWGKY